LWRPPVQLVSLLNMQKTQVICATFPKRQNYKAVHCLARENILRQRVCPSPPDRRHHEETFRWMRIATFRLVDFKYGIRPLLLINIDTAPPLHYITLHYIQIYDAPYMLIRKRIWSAAMATERLLIARFKQFSFKTVLNVKNISDERVWTSRDSFWHEISTF